MLRAGGIAPEQITVFVHSSDALDEYRRHLPDGVGLVVVPHDPHDRTLPTDDHPSLGLATARNGALDWMAREHGDEWVWFLDDDVDEVLALTVADGTPKTRGVTHVAALFREAEALAEEASVSLVGFAPSTNPMGLRHSRTAGLSFCIGQAFAVRASTPIRSWLAEKDDYERSILHYRHGQGCLRLNDICLRSKVYGGVGGLQLSRTFESSHAESAWLLERYPTLVRLNEKRSAPPGEGRAEILLRRTRDTSTWRVPGDWIPA